MVKSILKNTTFSWLTSFSSAVCKGVGISHTHLFFRLFFRFWRFFSCLSSLTRSSSENSSQSCSNRLIPCTFSTVIYYKNKAEIEYWLKLPFTLQGNSHLLILNDITHTETGISYCNFIQQSSKRILNFNTLNDDSLKISGNECTTNSYGKGRLTHTPVSIQKYSSFKFQNFNKVNIHPIQWEHYLTWLNDLVSEDINIQREKE